MRSSLSAAGRAWRLAGQAGLLLVPLSLSGMNEIPATTARECSKPWAASFTLGAQAPPARVWKSAADGLPPMAACMPHGPPGSQLWISVAGSSHAATPELLLARFGQVSLMREMKYWSISDHMWRSLFASATALTAPSGKERSDFSVAELQQGSPVYLQQADSRSSRKVVYEMKLLRADRQGIVLSMVNVSPLSWWGMTVYKAGDLETLYFLERAAGDEWRFYSLARMPVGNRLMNTQDGSYINRAVAMYRFIAGIPTDSEPPAVP